MKRFSGGLVLTVTFLLMAIFPAGAQQSTPPLSHECSRPVWPSDSASQSEVESFYEQVKAYRDCIERFIEAQNEVIQRHQETIKRHTQAAEAAAKEWNEFLESVKSRQQSPTQ
jgi:hypothetical protein